MAISDEKKFYTAVSRMDAGQEPKQVASDLDVSYATVIRWRREYVAAKEQGKLDQLLDLDKLAIELAIESSPTAGKLMPELKAVAKKVEGLQVLQEQFQATALFLNSQIKTRAASAESTGEVLDLVEGLCNLQNAFFNKQTTQVNVQNNYGGAGQSKYSGFLSDVPAGVAPQGVANDDH